MLGEKEALLALAFSERVSQGKHVRMNQLDEWKQRLLDANDRCLGLVQEQVVRRVLASSSWSPLDTRKSIAARRRFQLLDVLDPKSWHTLS